MKKTVSSWSLHRTLGKFNGASPAPGAHLPVASAGTGIPLLELPALLRENGFDAVQLCHFHFPSRDPQYLADLRAALAESDIELDAILVDDGDLTHPEDSAAHLAWIGGWVADATTLGARRARIIAGRSQPSDEALRVSVSGLRSLARDHDGIRIVTENWLELTPGPDEIHRILDEAEGSVGLLIDTGNWAAPDKYSQLASIAARGETCHAKCHFGPDGADTQDYRLALEALRDNGYDGPLALVYDDDTVGEWAGLEIEHAVVQSVFASGR